MRRYTKRTHWTQAVAVLLCCGIACEQSQPPAVPRAAASDDETDASRANGDEQRDTAAQSKPRGGKPRGGKPREHKPNRLAGETSLYLLMHAHNPVDWYPWGEEALEKAKKENKVIFLSIGYSSCHWCHVMERETFMDEEIAALMNENFVCIKVDREERPDVDDIYMEALQVYQQLTGSPRGGGWPLSMFLTPDGKPFFGGTYFPARDGDRGEGSTGFLTIIDRVRQAWTDQPDGLKQNAKIVAEATKAELEGGHFDGEIAIDEKLLAAAQAALAEEYDATYGGFGFDPRVDQRPKFPEPSNLFFLVDRARKANDAQAREMLVHTLERMAMGGVRDHVGGGFHRYSVDRMWRIPHFEKMLYDNGQLASVYTETYLLTGREDFRRVVDEMLKFVLREMTSPDGAFYSALDAESEGEEGKFYVWGKAEVESLLGDDEFKLFAAVYGLNGPPNFGDPPTVKTHFAPQLARPLREIAADRKWTEAELEQRLSPVRQKLFDARSQRERPLTDTKILTSWNGLMIRGFADAGRGLKNDKYVKAAERAADFLLHRLRTDDGRLLRTFGKGHAKLNAYLNDYAFLADGLIALFQTTGDAKWLTAADELTVKQLELFWDDENGGFFFISEDHETLLARAKNPYDGAQPSGNSVAAQNLVFLGRELKKAEYLEKAERTIGSLGALLSRAPAIAPRMMVAASMLLGAKAD